MAEKVKKEKGKSVFSGIVKFFREVRIEAIKRITWPTPKQVLNNSIIVIVTVLVIGAFIWLLDFVFTQGLQFALYKLPELFGK